MLNRHFGIKTFVTWLLLFFTASLFAVTPARLTNLQITADIHTTHILLQLDQNIKYRLFTLAHPNRVVIDLPNSLLKLSLKNIATNNTAISQVREGHPVPNVLRLVF